MPLWDKKGRGVMSVEALTFFLAGGCKPTCHICYCEIMEGDSYVMRPLTKKDFPEIDAIIKFPTVARVMLCEKCENDGKILTKDEVERFITLFRGEIPQPKSFGGCFMVDDIIIS